MITKQYFYLISLTLFAIGSSAAETATPPPGLRHVQTVQMEPGTHRPEILLAENNRIFIAVVQPGSSSDPEGQIKHKCYELDGTLQTVGDSFVLTRTTDEYGEPADHRAAIISNQIVVVYQSIVYQEGVEIVEGPAEDYAENQSLLIARFDLDGNELYRGPIVANATTNENFPDHCLAWDSTNEKLFISTGTDENLLKIRTIDLNGTINTTRTYTISEQTIPEEIGNSILHDGNNLYMFSAIGPSSYTLTATAFQTNLNISATTSMKSEFREQTFPTGNLLYNDMFFVGYISRIRGGDNSMTNNPYYPYLAVFDSNSLTQLVDMAVGNGNPGFSHTHPTMIRIDDRLLISWSMQGETNSSQPQVVIDEYKLSERAQTENDYDGDSMSDLPVFDSNSGYWYILSSTGTVVNWATQWGWPGATPVPGDYDNDDLNDMAVFDENTGYWYILSSTGTVVNWATQWGWPGAIPVPGNYNGIDGNDLAVFDENSGYWYIISSAEELIAWETQWGWPGATPVPGDYDGDSHADLAVFDENSGYWYIQALKGFTIAWETQWGWPGATPVPGDYNGDGKSDLAVFDNNSGYWYIASADENLIAWATQWGWPGATPVPGDYNGDGESDLAVFDNNTGSWYIVSPDGTLIKWATQWGWPGAVPVGSI